MVGVESKGLLTNFWLQALCFTKIQSCVCVCVCALNSKSNTMHYTTLHYATIHYATTQ